MKVKDKISSTQETIQIDQLPPAPPQFFHQSASTKHAATTSSRRNSIEPVTPPCKCHVTPCQCRRPSFGRQFSTFDHSQDRYKVFFKKIHVWLAAKWVIGAEVFISGCLIMDFILSGHQKKLLPETFASVGIYLHAASILATMLYAIGMYTKLEKFMIPRFVAQAVNCLIFVAYAAYCVVGVVAMHFMGYAWLGTGYVVAFLLQTYFIWILILAYRYVKDWKVYLAYA